MIRFSAALVAVAIGVLIGGIATSKLLLVYIAIVVSAVALVALAIGVLVKREELFGEGPGLVPAGAGAPPGRPAPAGEGRDQHRVAAEQHRPAVPVPPSAPFQGPSAGRGTAFGGTAFSGTAFGGATFGETAQVAPPAAAPPQVAANPTAPRQAPDGHGNRAGEVVPPWEAQSARDQWTSPPWPDSTAADPAPDWMRSGHGVSEPASQAETTVPSPTGAAVPPVPPAPPGPAQSGPAQSGTGPSGTGPSGTGPSGTGPSGPGPSGPGPSSPVPEPASPNWFAPKTRSADAAPPATDAPADAAPADETAPASDTAPVETAATSATDDEQEPGAETETESEHRPGPAEGGTRDAEPETGDAGGEPSSAGQAGPDTATALVAVVPGVPRYHQPDCVLIRFMPDGDIQRLTAAQAKADDCTPCAACHPPD